MTRSAEALSLLVFELARPEALDELHPVLLVVEVDRQSPVVCHDASILPYLRRDEARGPRRSRQATRSPAKATNASAARVAARPAARTR